MRRSIHNNPESSDEVQLGEVLEPDDYSTSRDDFQAEELSHVETEIQPDGLRYDHDDDPDEGKNFFQIAYGLANGVGILVGAAIIFLIAALLIGILHWLTGDISQFIAVFESGLK